MLDNQPLFAALDVSLEKTTVCVMSLDGVITKEAVVATDPEAIATCLSDDLGRLERVGLEAGPMSEWLVRGLADLGVSVVLMETRQVRAALSAMIIKTDRKDARGMAHLLRTGWFRPVHVKTVNAREQRAMLSARTTLVARLKDIENSVRGLLRGFGLRLPKALRGRWDAGVREAVGGHPTLLQILEPLLVARGALREQLILLDKRVRDAEGRSGLSAVDDGAWCRRDRRHDVPRRGRSTRSLPIVQTDRRLLRTDATQVPIGRDGSRRRHQPSWRRIGPGRPLRGRARDHDPGCNLVEAQSLGDERREAAGGQAGQGRARPQARRRSPPDVGR